MIIIFRKIKNKIMKNQQFRQRAITEPEMKIFLPFLNKNTVIKGRCQKKIGPSLNNQSPYRDMQRKQLIGAICDHMRSFDARENKLMVIDTRAFKIKNSLKVRCHHDKRANRRQSESFMKNGMTMKKEKSLDRLRDERKSFQIKGFILESHKSVMQKRQSKARRADIDKLQFKIGPWESHKKI